MSSYGADIRQFMLKASREEVSLVTRKLSLALLSSVVLRTPVDTGRARGNWQANVGKGLSVGGGETGQFDKGGGNTISTGSAVIATQRDFDAITLENNVPYIQKLEDGHSRQAPDGMVALALAQLGLAADRD